MQAINVSFLEINRNDTVTISYNLIPTQVMIEL
jgi:hypothetical protein